MKVAILQHVHYEGIGSIHPWLEKHAADVTIVRLYEKPSLPEPGGFDWLIVMGGPMNANDETAHPWLRPEKRCIAHAVSAGRIVLGICLGAQLIASALGARVFLNPFKEIGWFPTHTAGAAALIDNCRGDIVPGPYVQSAAEILAASPRFDELNRHMDSLLDFLAGEEP